MEIESSFLRMVGALKRYVPFFVVVVLCLGSSFYVTLGVLSLKGDGEREVSVSRREVFEHDIEGFILFDGDVFGAGRGGEVHVVIMSVILNLVNCIVICIAQK